MTSIEEYNLVQDEWVCVHSKICGVAESLAHIHPSSPLDSRINELIISYFNQWRFVIEAYDKLFILFKELNSASDQRTEIQIITEFDVKSLQLEIEFKNYSFLFIVALKSLIDIFACIIDIIQNQIVRAEDRMPDFFSYGKRKVENPINEITTEFEKLRAENDSCWIKQVNNIRNKIIHRGYLLKPIIGFHKEETLIIQTYKGANFYFDIDKFDLGALFRNFIVGMNQIDNAFADILCREILSSRITYEASFRYSNLMNEYNFKEILAI